MKKRRIVFIGIVLLALSFLFYIMFTTSSVTTSDDNDLAMGLQKIALGRVEKSQDYTIVINEKNPGFYSFIPTKNIVFAHHEVEMLFVAKDNRITIYRRIPSIAAQWREIIQLPTPSSRHFYQLSFILDCDACTIIPVKPDHNESLQAPIILDLGKLS